MASDATSPIHMAGHAAGLDSFGHLRLWRSHIPVDPATVLPPADTTAVCMVDYAHLACVTPTHVVVLRVADNHLVLNFPTLVPAAILAISAGRLLIFEAGKRCTLVAVPEGKLLAVCTAADGLVRSRAI